MPGKLFTMQHQKFSLRAWFFRLFIANSISIVLSLQTLHGETRCYTVHTWSKPLPTTKHRVPASLTDNEFRELAAMAEKYDVSLAWLTRKAILEFIDRYRSEQLQLPLNSRSSQLGRTDSLLRRNLNV